VRITFYRTSFNRAKCTRTKDHQVWIFITEKWLLNTHIFADEDFLPSAVTDSQPQDNEHLKKFLTHRFSRY
jgi:hypothetical protein